MRYITKHVPPRYRRSSNTKRKRRKLPLILLLLGLFTAGALLSEAGLSSVSEELTKEAARSYILASINQAVNQELEDGENSFVSVEKGNAGQVASVSANTAELNALKTGVLSRLSQKLNGRSTVYVPIGSLTDVGIFNGRGFQVPIKLQFEGSADVSFDTEFASAGINQSCHRITMTVQAQVYSQSKRFETFVETGTATVLAETVVVGTVPDVAVVRK